MNLTTNNSEIDESKTEWGKRIEEAIFETGLSVRAFAEYVGYKHPSTFYAAIKKRKISPKLMRKIIEGYQNKMNVKLNPQWIEKGVLPKILTQEMRMRILENVEERSELYNTKCLKCIENEKEIANLKAELMELQKQHIECLKEVSALKNAALG